MASCVRMFQNKHFSWIGVTCWIFLTYNETFFNIVAVVEGIFRFSVGISPNKRLPTNTTSLKITAVM